MEKLDALRKAGKILERALKRSFLALESGERMGISIADAVEEEIRSRGRPAFPCNIGVDEVAAHFAPTDSNPADFSTGALLKVDAGAHVDGWIADAAFTYVLDDRYTHVARAAYDALYEAVHIIRPGVEVQSVGKKISEIAKNYGVKPISNLGGHQIEKYTLHAGLFIPNVPEGRGKVEEDMIIAIEPFMTNGRGRVRDGATANIFSLIRPRARSPVARKIVEYIQREYMRLPFAQKWIERRFGDAARLALYELLRNGSLHQYPVLLENAGSVVAQFETTVYVDKDGAEIIVDVFDLTGW